MSWTDVARTKAFLGIPTTDTKDDAAITEAVASANASAYMVRATSGYVDDPDTAPNAAVADGTTRTAALLFQSRGTGAGFVLIDNVPTGTPGYEQRRTINALLGVPRPTVDVPITGAYAPVAGPPGVGVPPGGTASQVLSKASGADYDTEWRTINRTTAPYHYAGASYETDPGAGGVGIDVTGGSTQRGLAFSATDDDGTAHNFGVLLPGDTLTLFNPTTGGYARYVLTSTPVLQGDTWWSFNANRSDTSGSTQAPPLGTPLVAVFTLAGGV